MVQIMSLIFHKMYSKYLGVDLRSVPCGLVARIRGFHPRGPGSIPGMGKCFDRPADFFFQVTLVSPGFELRCLFLLTPLFLFITVIYSL